MQKGVHLCLLIIKRNILILRKGPTQVSDGTTLTSKAEYSITFSEQQEFV